MNSIPEIRHLLPFARSATHHRRTYAAPPLAADKDVHLHDTRHSSSSASSPDRDNVLVIWWKMSFRVFFFLLTHDHFAVTDHLMNTLRWSRTRRRFDMTRWNDSCSRHNLSVYALYDSQIRSKSRRLSASTLCWFCWIGYLISEEILSSMGDVRTDHSSCRSLSSTDVSSIVNDGRSFLSLFLF